MIHDLWFKQHSKCGPFSVQVRVIMQKSILIGNGINIQFGGFENYSNTAILKRMFRNIRAGKYCPLFPDFSIAEQLGLFEVLRDILVNNNRYHISEAS